MVAHKYPLFALVLIVAIGWAARARGADPTAAEAAFQQGLQLMKAGDNAAACPKLEESYALDPAVGVLMYLADCHERIGRLASALEKFRAAAVFAKAAGMEDRVQKANQRASQLEARMPKLTVIVPADGRVPGLAITRDGVAIAQALWGTSMLVDPGPHEVVVAAAGYEPYRQQISVDEGGTAVVQVPVLRPGAGVPAPALLPPVAAPIKEKPQQNPWSKTRIAGIALGAVGLVGVGVGAGFGIATFTTWSAASGNCESTGDPRPCNPDGVRLGERAHLFGLASTGLFIAGGVVAGAGLILAIAAPNAKSVVAVRGLPGGVVATGSF